MPIKGTLKRVENENWKPLWKKLVSDKKSQAELFMISDLLRNDLSRIEKPRAQIVKKKYPKLVPGLIHQYSQIDVELSDDVNLWRVIEKIFPGGSITGAPKVRAMKLIHELEKRNRGFYCGSTLILLKEMKSASINIRSSEISFSPNEKKLLYQAGGGITLMSNVFEEYCEMTYKHDSFISTLTL
jgi:anthranilate/para-aminobenzoate synthase component I